MVQRSRVLRAFAGARPPATRTSRKSRSGIVTWGDGVDAKPYGVPSQFEKDVVRRNVPWLTADATSSVNFTPLHDLDGIITPNGLCFERHHSGVAEIPPQDHRLMINGLIDKPLVVTMDDLKRFPAKTASIFSNALPIPAWSGAARS